MSIFSSCASILGFLFAGATTPASNTQSQVSKSLRFNSIDSTYLIRTPATGNRKTWTWSGWVKRSSFGSRQNLFQASASTAIAPLTYFEFDANNKIQIAEWTGSANNYQLLTTQVFADPGAFFHLLVAFDSTQVTASDRIRLYINGAQVTAFDTATYPTQNFDSSVNSNIDHSIGRDLSGSNYFNGYLAEIHFIDGQALAPSRFGQFDTNNQWQPIIYTGTYGTNGFKLNFSDNSTVSNLGKDSTANVNNWTPNNFSVTAGAGNDSLVDSPSSYGTDTGSGGQVRGNYCTLNPLTNDGAYKNTLSNGNLQAVGGNNLTTISTFGMRSGKWYCEVTIDAVGASCHVGIAKNNVNFGNWLGWDALGWSYGNSGLKYTNTASTGGGSAYGSTYTTGDVIGIAFDADGGNLYFYKNGAIQNGGTAAFTGLTNGPYFFGFGASSPSVTFNFGARLFNNTAPANYKVLCDTNLPTPTIAKSNTAMDVVLYAGNGYIPDSRTTQKVTGLNFSPDFVWIKCRNVANAHFLFDTFRGVGRILTTGPGAEYGDTDPNSSFTVLKSFDSNGFTVDTQRGQPVDMNGLNRNGEIYVSYCFEGGTSTVTNTNGGISSQVRANTTTGLSILSYIGNTYVTTVGHGLNAVPSLMLIKATTGWCIYHSSLGKDAYLSWSTTDPAVSSGGFWGSAEPTSTVFGIGTFTPPNYANPGYGYCFAPIAGFSVFGDYLGTSSNDGPFVYTGFRPKWIMIKNSTVAAPWVLIDSVRIGFNSYSSSAGNARLYVNTGDTEAYDMPVDILSNGFKIRTSDNSVNGTACKMLYAAFAEFPQKYARAR